MEKLVEEGVTLSITGSIACGMEHNLNMVIEIRETTPSGTRKRIRSFGTVAVIVSSYCASAADQLAVGTKRAKKRVETLLKKLEQCQSLIQVEMDDIKSEQGDDDDQASEANRSSAKRSKQAYALKREDTEFLSVMDNPRSADVRVLEFSDGGELLSFVGRSADVCAHRIVAGDTDAQAAEPSYGSIASSLEWMCAKKSSDDVDLADPIEQVRLKTELVEVSYEWSGGGGSTACALIRAPPKAPP